MKSYGAIKDGQTPKKVYSVYKTDHKGKTIIGQSKKGVPLSDVWEIPFLNPKAKLGEAAYKLIKSSRTKQCSFMILVRTHIDSLDLFDSESIPDNMRIIDNFDV